MNSSSFIRALHTEGSASDRVDKLGLYGQFIGSWETDSVFYGDDGSQHKNRGEIHWGWVLQGRAIQDVWILPGLFYGSTLRVYDPGIDAWHIFWSDPLKQYYMRQIGRARGKDIVQEGIDNADVPKRWSFTEITPNSFHWLGERSSDGGATWRLELEIFARRVVA
jgi:hypothetical protein